MRRSITIGVVVGALLLGAVTGWAVSGFTDIPEDSPHAPAIEWAVDAGIISGKTADTFDPDGPLTRAQMITILHRYHNAFPTEVIDYTEADLVLPGTDHLELVLRVGTHIQPGVYTVEYKGSSRLGCIIQRLSGLQYTEDEVIWSVERYSRGRIVLDIDPSDVAVRFQYCNWT